MNGATTGSFVASGQFNITLANVKEQVAAGRRTIATLQFGTNDQKVCGLNAAAYKYY
jgi:lysophospholipase L1-like esterase